MCTVACVCTHRLIIICVLCAAVCVRVLRVVYGYGRGLSNFSNNSSKITADHGYANIIIMSCISCMLHAAIQLYTHTHINMSMCGGDGRENGSSACTAYCYNACATTRSFLAPHASRDAGFAARVVALGCGFSCARATL